jgi:hypothetical protein
MAIVRVGKRYCTVLALIRAVQCDRRGYSRKVRKGFYGNARRTKGEIGDSCNRDFGSAAAYVAPSPQ